jgi:Beta-lactamase superfamily domain
MNSPRYEPAGLLVQHGKMFVLIDGGGRAPKYELAAWLVTDERSELISKIRKLARPMGLEPAVTSYSSTGLIIKPHSIVHTSHDTYGYTIEASGKKIIWAPEFLKFPRWAKGADLMFAEASAWNRPILFRGGVGGHASVAEVASEAQKYEVSRLIYAHIGRPTIKAIDEGKRAVFGEFGKDGDIYVITKRAISKRTARSS